MCPSVRFKKEEFSLPFHKLWNSAAGCWTCQRVGWVQKALWCIHGWIYHHDLLSPDIKQRVLLENKLKVRWVLKNQWSPLAMSMWSETTQLDWPAFWPPIEPFLCCLHKWASFSNYQLWFVAQCSTGRAEKHIWFRKGWRFVVKALEAWLRLNVPSTGNAPRLWGALWPHHMSLLPKDIPQSYLLNNGI